VTDPNQSGPHDSDRYAILLYDNDCGFCSRAMQWLHDHNALGHTNAMAWRILDPQRLPVTPERLDREIILVQGDEIHGGAAAFAVVLANARLPWRLAGRCLGAPVVRHLAAYIYRKVAANRHRMPGGTAACEIPTRPTASPRPDNA